MRWLALVAVTLALSGASVLAEGEGRGEGGTSPLAERLLPPDVPEAKLLSEAGEWLLEQMRDDEAAAKPGAGAGSLVAAVRRPPVHDRLPLRRRGGHRARADDAVGGDGGRALRRRGPARRAPPDRRGRPDVLGPRVGRRVGRRGGAGPSHPPPGALHGRGGDRLGPPDVRRRVRRPRGARGRHPRARRGRRGRHASRGRGDRDVLGGRQPRRDRRVRGDRHDAARRLARDGRGAVPQGGRPGGGGPARGRHARRRRLVVARPHRRRAGLHGLLPRRRRDRGDPRPDVRGDGRRALPRGCATGGAVARASRRARDGRHGHRVEARHEVEGRGASAGRLVPRAGGDVPSPPAPPLADGRGQVPRGGRGRGAMAPRPHGSLEGPRRVGLLGPEPLLRGRGRGRVPRGPRPDHREDGVPRAGGGHRRVPRPHRGPTADGARVLEPLRATRGEARRDVPRHLPDDRAGRLRDLPRPPRPGAAAGRPRGLRAARRGRAGTGAGETPGGRRVRAGRREVPPQRAPARLLSRRRAGTPRRHGRSRRVARPLPPHPRGRGRAVRRARDDGREPEPSRDPCRLPRGRRRVPRRRARLADGVGPRARPRDARPDGRGGGRRDRAARHGLRHRVRRLSTKPTVLPAAPPEDGIAWTHAYFPLVETDPEVRAAVPKTLEAVAGAGLVEFGGNGDAMRVWLFSDRRNAEPAKWWPYDPARVLRDLDHPEMPGIGAKDLASWDLAGKVVWFSTCHSGAPTRTAVWGDVVSTFGDTGRLVRFHELGAGREPLRGDPRARAGRVPRARGAEPRVARAGRAAPRRPRAPLARGDDPSRAGRGGAVRPGLRGDSPRGAEGGASPRARRPSRARSCGRTC